MRILVIEDDAVLIGPHADEQATPARPADRIAPLVAIALDQRVVGIAAGGTKLIQVRRVRLFERIEAAQAVQPVLDELSHVDREVVQVYYWDELPAADIGQIVGLSKAAVWQRLSRLRQVLRARLSGRLKEKLRDR